MGKGCLKLVAGPWPSAYQIVALEFFYKEQHVLYKSHPDMDDDHINKIEHRAATAATYVIIMGNLFCHIFASVYVGLCRLLLVLVVLLIVAEGPM